MAKQEVFWCSAPQSEHRQRVAAQTKEWWLDQPGIKFIEVNPSTLRCTAIEFNLRRRQWAEDQARGDFYILADDDCLPLLRSEIPVGFETIAEHPEFALISAWPANCSISRWTPEPQRRRCICNKQWGAACSLCNGHGYQEKEYIVYEDLQVMEVNDVGGLRYCRTGAMKYWPAPAGPGYDAIHCLALREQGWRVGYFQHVRMTHLGEGYSDIWNSVMKELSDAAKA